MSQILLNVPDALRIKIILKVGNGQVSQFIRDAVIEKLEKLKADEKKIK